MVRKVLFHQTGNAEVLQQARIQNNLEPVREFNHLARDILGVTQAGLLQLAEFSFRTIKYWSGFAGDF